MDKLTDEEVSHVANLARIEITDEEKEVYKVQLKQLINEIDKIKNVEVNDEEMLITPIEHNARMRNDEVGNVITFDDVKTNVPKSLGNFVEVVVMLNE